MESKEKEVYFNIYCPLCVNYTTDEEDDPCYECLATPSNMDSHKPVKYKKLKLKGSK